MQQYHSKAGTPLKFHNFFRYILLPLNFISTAITMYQEFSVMTQFTWPYAVDGFFFAVSLILMLSCVVGFFGWKPYSWYSVMAFLGILVVSGICNAAIYAAYVPEELSNSVGQLLVAILEAALIGIYYYKRRPLFFSDAQQGAAGPGVMDARFLDSDDEDDLEIVEEDADAAPEDAESEYAELDYTESEDADSDDEVPEDEVPDDDESDDEESDDDE